MNLEGHPRTTGATGTSGASRAITPEPAATICRAATTGGEAGLRRARPAGLPLSWRLRH